MKLYYYFKKRGGMRYLHILVRRLFFYLFNLGRYKKLHFSSYVQAPIIITPSCISLHKYVIIGNNARIEGVYQYNDVLFTPHIEFHNGVRIEQNLHLTCANKIVVGCYTSIGANVTITDIHHSYEDIKKPIEKNDIVVKSVVIGDECKIYNNVVILPGVTIGKHVTVGANSVVTHDIPDYCVAVGAPAKVVKQYNQSTNKWESVKYV